MFLFFVSAGLSSRPVVVLSVRARRTLPGDDSYTRL